MNEKLANKPNGISDRSRLSLRCQSFVSRLFAPFWLLLVTLLMRVVMGWRIRDLVKLRSEYKDLRGSGPVMICGNHLTMADSAIIAYALASPAWFLWRWFALPWNVPEWENFASNRISRVFAWLTKCVPIRRGGPTELVSDSLNRLTWLLQNGQTVLIFPEAGRSRTGRISLETPAHGVGRILTRVPETRVLCVYARGDQQHTWGNLPCRGEQFAVSMREVFPRSERGGLRGSVDMTNQILQTLVEMEAEHFSDSTLNYQPQPLKETS